MLEFEKKEFQIWLETMKYVRTVSGTIYEDQLKKMVQDKYKDANKEFNCSIKIIDFLNGFKLSGSSQLNGKTKFLKKHPITSEVYTIPESRKILDPILKENFEDYTYNPELYLEEYKRVNSEQITISFSDEENIKKVFELNVCNYDVDLGELNIDFSFVRNHKDNERILCGAFDIQKIVSYLKKNGNFDENFHLGSINATNVVFDGVVNLSYSDAYVAFLRVTGGLDFSGATFLKDVVVQNFTFDFSNTKKQCIDFRNVRFFANVLIRNLKFIGTTNDSCFTLEDARVSGNLEIYNTDFEHTSLYCFQMIFDKCKNAERKKVSIVNVSFEDDAHIDLIDVSLTGADVKFENIPLLPNTELCFCGVNKQSLEVCPDIRFLILNSEIVGTLKVSNVSEISMRDSHNFGRIVEASDWFDVDAEDWKNRYNKEYRTKTKGVGRTTITSKLLLAVYNNTWDEDFDSNKNNRLSLSKCYDFLLLKENFLSMGFYEFEDVAYILYMEFKPFLDSRLSGVSKGKVKKRKSTKIVYDVLYMAGKYGISPLRVCNSIFAAIALFSVLYFIIAYNAVDFSYAFGKIEIDASNIGGQVLAAFLYSLGCIVPFISQFEPLSMPIVIVSAIENFIGTFLVGYFSVAVIRKTLR